MLRSTAPRVYRELDELTKITLSALADAASRPARLNANAAKRLIDARTGGALTNH
jgi:hypothetical protein